MTYHAGSQGVNPRYTPSVHRGRRISANTRLASLRLRRAPAEILKGWPRGTYSVATASLRGGPRAKWLQTAHPAKQTKQLTAETERARRTGGACAATSFSMTSYNMCHCRTSFIRCRRRRGGLNQLDRMCGTMSCAYDRWYSLFSGRRNAPCVFDVQSLLAGIPFEWEARCVQRHSGCPNRTARSSRKRTALRAMTFYASQGRDQSRRIVSAVIL